MAGLAVNIWRIVRADGFALAGLAILGAVVAVAALAPLVATHDPNAVNERVEGVVVAFDGTRWEAQEAVADRPLNAVALAAPAEGLAVGAGGRAVRLDGGVARDLDTGVDATLRGVALAGGVAVAVGHRGTVLHLEGDRWVPATSGTGRDLHAVALAPGGTGLAVGEAGTALAWDGQRWAAVDTGVDHDLHAVSLPAADSGVVVGDRGTILRYDGRGFEPVEAAGFRDLHGVDALADGTILTVGERGVILHHEPAGQQGEPGDWSQMHSPESRDLRDVHLLDASSALAVGIHGVVLRMDGDRWEREDTGYPRTLRAVAGAGGALAAVGTDPFVDQLAAPSRAHLFGTTHLGRDIFSQTVWGSRTALMVGFLAALMVVGIGTNVGLVAGYFKGWSGNLLMRVVDVMYALPFEPFALVLVLLFRPSLTIVILAIGLLTWRTTARIIRSQVLSLAERPFVKAARVAGASDWRILYVHIAPNVLPLAFLQLAVAMAFAITAEATLSFLGLGPQQVYSWGTILHEARLSGAWRTAWWWILPPGIFIVCTVVAVFFIARALEVLTNPRLAVRG